MRSPPSHLVLIVTIVLFVACSTAKTTTGLHWKHSAVFLTDERINTVRARVSQKLEPTYSAWVKLKQRCDDGLSRKPSPVEKWSVPGFYDGHEAQQAAKLPLEIDATQAYEEALCYRITGNVAYSENASQILLAWMTGLKTTEPDKVDSKLTMSYHFPPMIVAADLIRAYPGWDELKQAQFKIFIRNLILPLNTMIQKTNNHANWGMVLVLSIATYLDDEELFKKAEARFRELVDIQITPDGTLPNEVDRSDTKNTHGGPTKGKNGLWYTNFALMPTTLSAEILRINGYEAYSYSSPKGGNLRVAFERAATWSLHPETFPYYHSTDGQLKGTKYVHYFEMLNVLWPDPSATELLRRLRPLTTETAFPDLTLTHGSLGPQALLENKGQN